MTKHSYHYATIARALREMDAAGPGLTLDALAARIGLSPAHFQRTFSQWVGVSPKRYQQYLALDHARDLLAQRFSLLHTAHETGLSGTGRLHEAVVHPKRCHRAVVERLALRDLVFVMRKDEVEAATMDVEVGPEDRLAHR